MSSYNPPQLPSTTPPPLLPSPLFPFLWLQPPSRYPTPFHVWNIPASDMEFGWGTSKRVSDRSAGCTLLKWIVWAFLRFSAMIWEKKNAHWCNKIAAMLWVVCVCVCVCEHMRVWSVRSAWFECIVLPLHYPEQLEGNSALLIFLHSFYLVQLLLMCYVVRRLRVWWYSMIQVCTILNHV